MDYQTQPLTMWFDRRLVLRASSIHGIGTFATHDIEAGALLMLVIGGLIVRPGTPEAAQLQLAAELYNQATVTDGVLIVTPKLFHYYINHSCDPNAIDVTQRATSTQYVALRPIQANEEITADYYNETTLTVCTCQSPRCRWRQQEA